MSEQFTDDERGIFLYHVYRSRKVKQIAADPMLLHRRFKMAMQGQTIQRALDDCSNDDDAVAMPAQEKLQVAFTSMFGVPGLDEDGTGMTEKQMYKAFTDLMDFFSLPGETPATSPPSLPSTDPPSSAEGPSTTTPDVDCC